MKDIKFRGWDDEIKKIVPIHKLDFNIKYGYYQDDNAEWGRVKLENLMQYTGLKDRNGKEIYEGDLISHNGEIYQIVFNNGGFTVKNTDSVSSVPASNDFLSNINANVIGNIYENIDLLKG